MPNTHTGATRVSVPNCGPKWRLWLRATRRTAAARRLCLGVWLAERNKVVAHVFIQIAPPGHLAVHHLAPGRAQISRVDWNCWPRGLESAPMRYFHLRPKPRRPARANKQTARQDARLALGAWPVAMRSGAKLKKLRATKALGEPARLAVAGQAWRRQTLCRRRSPNWGHWAAGVTQGPARLKWPAACLGASGGAASGARNKCDDEWGGGRANWAGPLAESRAPAGDTWAPGADQTCAAGRGRPPAPGGQVAPGPAGSGGGGRVCRQRGRAGALICMRFA